MKTVGLITEYNPFHHGHAWHIQESKRLSGADFCVVVMSGNFVQRGAPAILDKYSRAHMALACGADLVLELPVAYALGSAEYFASGAVTLLNSLHTVDALCFGSECGDLSSLAAIARILAKEPESYRLWLKQNLKAGDPFPLARTKAMSAYLQSLAQDFDASLITEPNNILGIEYLKALHRHGSAICPLTIPRRGGAYHAERFDTQFSSAAALRKQLKDSANASCLLPMKQEVPEPVFQILSDAFGKSLPICSNDFSLLLHYRLLDLSSPEEICLFQDISKELADRIWRLIPDFESFEQFTALVKTRQYTESRIRRCLFHILLNIRSQEVARQIACGWHSSVRVLGFRKDSTPLLHKIKEKCHLPLITRPAAARKLLTPEAMQAFQKEIAASHIYQSVVTDKFSKSSYHEYRQRPIIL